MGTRNQFLYAVGRTVVESMATGGLHEWTRVESKAICRKHAVHLIGGRANLLDRVASHYASMHRWVADRQSSCSHTYQGAICFADPPFSACAFTSCFFGGAPAGEGRDGDLLQILGGSAQNWTPK